jgi:hypothetical protein
MGLRVRRSVMGYFRGACWCISPIVGNILETAEEEELQEMYEVQFFTENSEPSLTEAMRAMRENVASLIRYKKVAVGPFEWCAETGKFDDWGDWIPRKLAAKA